MSMATILAQTSDSSFALHPNFWPGVFGTLVYGVIGIGLLILGFKLFDWLTPRIDFQRELAEKQNVALAIVVAAILLGICYIVATAIQ